MGDIVVLSADILIMITLKISFIVQIVEFADKVAKKIFSIVLLVRHAFLRKYLLIINVWKGLYARNAPYASKTNLVLSSLQSFFNVVILYIASVSLSFLNISTNAPFALKAFVIWLFRKEI